MEMLSDTIGLAFMLMLVMEGLIYALFPSQIKRLLLTLTAMPPERIRSFALGVMAIGAIGCWYYLK